MSDFSLPTDSVGEILASGFLVQWEGINPGTGEAWKPVWVSREECPAEVVARWEARMKYKGLGIPHWPSTYFFLTKWSHRCYPGSKKTSEVGFSTDRVQIRDASKRGE